MTVIVAVGSLALTALRSQQAGLDVTTLTAPEDHEQPAPVASAQPSTAPKPAQAPAVQPVQTAPPPQPRVVKAAEPTPKPAVKPSSPVEVTAPPPAQPATGRVVLEGEVDELRIVSGSTRYSAGEVPVGSYDVSARFPGRGLLPVGLIQVREGQTVTISCNAAFAMCKVGP